MSQVDNKEIVAKATRLAQSGDFSGSIDMIETIGDGLSEEPSALYVQGVCLRKLQRHDDAIEKLEQVLELDSQFVRAYQELGHVFIAQKKAMQAIQSYETAVKMDPALIASWRTLHDLYAAARDTQKQQTAKRYVDELSQLAPALQAVKSHLNRGNIETADQICRQYLQKNKKDVEAMRLLASIAVNAKILDDAEFLLESAVEFEPDHIGVRYDYSNVLLRRQKFGLAHKIAKQLYDLRPTETPFKILLAATTTGVGETKQGVHMYQQLLNDFDEMDDYYLLLGHAQKTSGDIDGSIDSYQTLYKKNPYLGDAFWSLANTKTYTFSDSEIAHMRDYKERDETSAIDKVHFNFALGKALEDQQDYDAAFTAYENGNRQNRELIKYQTGEMVNRVDWQMDRCDAGLFSKLKNAGCSSDAPIFILGMPRAGSTLLEQIIASHSMVDGTHELPNVLSLVHRMQGRDNIKIGQEPPYPKLLNTLKANDFKQLGQQYIDDTLVYRQGAPYFIDKMPNNFLHIGLIKLILPNAKVIDARRHPMACCFSNFKQLFAEGQEFTYSLNDLGDYYRNYLRVMDHWDQVLPGFVLKVQHEEVVNDLEVQVRRMLDFCGLPFEQACLEFFKTQRNVRTPSSEQVRQPIYKTGLEHWRNFETHLNPLKEGLGRDVLARYSID